MTNLEGLIRDEKFINKAIERTLDCNHCIYEESLCEVKLADECVSNIKKWLEMEAEK